VPEVYGWCREGDEVFIYMQLVQYNVGEAVLDSLSLSTADKIEVCEQLHQMMGALRRLEQR
jgi:hypothetical protein